MKIEKREPTVAAGLELDTRKEERLSDVSVSSHRRPHSRPDSPPLQNGHALAAVSGDSCNSDQGCAASSQKEKEKKKGAA